MDHIIAGAVFDFAAHLSTLENPITCGAKYETAPALMDTLRSWARDRGLNLDKVDHNWMLGLGQPAYLAGATDGEVIGEAATRIRWMIEKLTEACG